MMKMQHSIQIRERHGAERNAGNTQQVNCKGDKIENIGQLLMHLGMDDIKDRCGECDTEIRSICLDKRPKIVSIKQNEIVSIKQNKTVSIKQNKTVPDKTLTESQCTETNLLKSRGSSDRSRAVESKLILSSIFTSLFVAVMTFH